MSKKLFVAAFCAAALMTACGGGDDPVVVPAVTEAVPAAAATSPTAATQYVADLTATAPAQTDTLEPVSTLPDSLATDDTAEPKAID